MNVLMDHATMEEVAQMLWMIITVAVSLDMRARTVVLVSEVRPVHYLERKNAPWRKNYCMTSWRTPSDIYKHGRCEFGARYDLRALCPWQDYKSFSRGRFETSLRSEWKPAQWWAISPTFLLHQRATDRRKEGFVLNIQPLKLFRQTSC